MRLKPNNARQGAIVLAAADVVWALGSICALHQKSFAAHLLTQEFPPTPPATPHCTGVIAFEDTGAAHTAPPRVIRNRPFYTPRKAWAFASSRSPFRPKTAPGCPCRFWLHWPPQKKTAPVV